MSRRFFLSCKTRFQSTLGCFPIKTKPIFHLIAKLFYASFKQPLKMNSDNCAQIIKLYKMFYLICSYSVRIIKFLMFVALSVLQLPARATLLCEITRKSFPLRWVDLPCSLLICSSRLQHKDSCTPPPLWVIFVL